MLSEELLKINKIAQGEVGLMLSWDWFKEFDFIKQREIVLMTRMCVERANPKQKGVDYLIERGFFSIVPYQFELIKKEPYDKAILKISEVADGELFNSFIGLMFLLQHFDDVQRKTVCKNGCDHEWHNLTWNIRTKDPRKLADFYSSLGLQVAHHKHGTTFHYSIPSGQSLLNIYALTKTNKDLGLGLHIKFTLNDFDGIIKSLKEKKVTFSTDVHETDAGLKAVVLDPDGRKITLLKS
jgi:hypothetical protein